MSEEKFDYLEDNIFTYRTKLPPEQVLEKLSLYVEKPALNPFPDKRKYYAGEVSGSEFKLRTVDSPGSNFSDVLVVIKEDVESTLLQITVKTSSVSKTAHLIYGLGSLSTGFIVVGFLAYAIGHFTQKMLIIPIVTSVIALIVYILWVVTYNNAIKGHKRFFDMFYENNLSMFPENYSESITDVPSEPTVTKENLDYGRLINRTFIVGMLVYGFSFILEIILGAFNIHLVFGRYSGKTTFLIYMGIGLLVYPIYIATRILISSKKAQ